MSNRAFIRSYQAFPENGDEHHMCVSMDTLRWMDKRAGYQEGYSEAEKNTIERAVDWLEKNVWESTGIDYSTLTDAFRKAMEEDVNG